MAAKAKPRPSAPATPENCEYHIDPADAIYILRAERPSYDCAKRRAIDLACAAIEREMKS